MRRLYPRHEDSASWYDRSGNKSKANGDRALEPEHGRRPVMAHRVEIGGAVTVGVEPDQPSQHRDAHGIGGGIEGGAEQGVEAVRFGVVVGRVEHIRGDPVS